MACENCGGRGFALIDDALFDGHQEANCPLCARGLEREALDIQFHLNKAKHWNIPFDRYGVLRARKRRLIANLEALERRRAERKAA